MKTISKSIVFSLIFVTLSCKSQNSFDSYKSCMDKSFQYTEVDFYGSLGIIEDSLLEAAALKSKSKESYIEAFQSLLSNDTAWKSHYEMYKNLEKKSLKGFDLKINRFVFIGTCSSINPSNEDVKCSSEYVQRYLFNQFVQKPFDDVKLLDGLFLFTDFKDDILRKNITYLLLLNMEKKYGVDDGTSNE